MVLLGWSTIPHEAGVNPNHALANLFPKVIFNLPCSQLLLLCFGKPTVYETLSVTSYPGFLSLFNKQKAKTLPKCFSDIALC